MGDAFERARNRATEQKAKLDMNQDALYLMDRLSASCVTKLEILLIPFSIGWELIAADLILTFQCADCPFFFVKACIYTTFIFFILTIGYSIAAVIITFAMFVAQLPFCAPMVK